MMRNDEATLVTITRNKQTPIRNEKTLFCGKKSVRSSEFYAATQVGFTPKYVLEFDLDDYQSSFINVTESGGKTKIQEPTECIYDGQTYNIIRTYEPDNYTIEVTIGK